MRTTSLGMGTLMQLKMEWSPGGFLILHNISFSLNSVAKSVNFKTSLFRKDLMKCARDTQTESKLW